MFLTSEPSTYQMLNDILWPAKLMCAIVLAYLVHESIGRWVDRQNDDYDDPDCPA